MPPTVTREEAARIAALAKLEMSEAELDRAARELESILGHFEALAAVDTRETGAAPADAAAPPLRADVPLPPLDADGAFANAPDADRDAGLFRVPRVLGS
ncbi:MAG TPA: Asp-tRNA(Asn)/Glu-tRNA(Gln) amidotransferase subunit GatC [Vicinamibacterales bacterium]|nr:Asp-tRNA(Asn)/Glu-tRNA(Gln) amidotransferase subunit GatC [Vicinamibacterales bacterium]